MDGPGVIVVGTLEACRFSKLLDVAMPVGTDISTDGAGLSDKGTLLGKEILLEASTRLLNNDEEGRGGAVVGVTNT